MDCGVSTRAFSTSAAIVACVVLLLPHAAQAMGQNGGDGCAQCTIFASLTTQLHQAHGVSGIDAIARLCSYLPFPLNIACTNEFNASGPSIAALIDAGETPDVICNTLGMCTVQTAVCRLFPPTVPSDQLEAHMHRLRVQHPKLQKFGRSFNICSIVPGVCRFENLEPFSDADGDLFSTLPSLRGSFWRGKDCNDTDATVFPGRSSTDQYVDSNCNGIYGQDARTGQTYEQMWCANSGAMGVAALGDSATAHFRIPPEYFMGGQLNSTTFANLYRVLENEFDWPMLSWSTGHLPASEFGPEISGPVVSLYSLMRERNLCNHRDYQNIGVNGATVSDLLPFDTVLNRNGSSAAPPAKPLLLIMSMVGNDVCNRQHDFTGMTTPAAYYQSVLAALRDADSFLPRGSHVIVVPLLDGRFLFNAMHARIHPIGQLNQDVTYSAFYDYLNCLDISPCWGWLNTNASVRNETTAIAMSLGAQLSILINNTKGTWQNIDVHNVGNVYDLAIDSFQPQSDMWQLIEPSDGFHPSQLANSIIGQVIFQLIANNTNIIAPPNPFNGAILAKFGDQGGY